MSGDIELARTTVRSLRNTVPRGTRWLHVKSGHDYMIHSHVLIGATLTPAVVYSRFGQAELWCRPAAEFLDGRFKQFEE